MKKSIRVFLLMIFFVLLFGVSKVNASAGSTVFIGEPIVLDSYENVEITCNYVEINEEKSQIKNTQIFTNTSNELLTKKASIKLEDSYSNLTINSLKILVNNLEIKEITKEGDNYIFYFQIKPNEAKKIEISYKTDSDLQNAKLIKYTMDAIKGQNVKIFQINVKLSKYDIPLVEKIWPGAYEFENNIVSTEYVDFNVNNLTSTFIIQKNTYKNIKYGDYSDTYSEADMYIINNAKEIIDNGFEIVDGKYGIDDDEVYRKLIKSEALSDESKHLLHHDNPISSIYYYVKALILEKSGKQYENGEKLCGSLMTEASYVKNYCLTGQTISRICKDGIIQRSGEGETRYYINPVLYGKTVAIDYYETEGDKELYVYKNVNNGFEEEAEWGYVKRSEYDILRTVNGRHWVTGPSYRGYKTVYVNSDIDGNKIDVTQKEMIDFVNMMNIDLYITVIIYDTADENSPVKAGYYSNNMKEIAEEYVQANSKIEDYKKSIQEIKEKYESGESDLEWYTSIKKSYEDYIKKAESMYIRFDDEKELEANVKIPTIAQCIAYRNYKDGKYVVDYSEMYAPDFQDSFGHIYEATECETAKSLLKANKANNDTKRQAILSKISSSKISTDEEEYIKPVEKANENIQNNDENFKIFELIKSEYRYIIVVAAMVLIIIMILIILLINKGRKK